MKAFTITSIGGEHMKEENIGLQQGAIQPPVLMTSVRWKTVTPTLLILWIVGVIDKIGVSVIATNPVFLREMHLIGNNALIGSLVSALLFSYGIGFFVWGWLTDKFGPRRCALIGLAFWGISTGIAAVSPDFTTLFLSRILLGFSEAFLWPVSNSLTARWFPLSERGRAKAIWVNGISVGSGIAGFVVTSLIGIFAWRGVFWFLTLAALLLCIPMVFFLVKDFPSQDPRVSETELQHIQTEQIVEEIEHKNQNIMTYKSYWMIVISFTGTVLGVYGLGSWFPSYLAIVKHFSPSKTSSFMLLAYGIALIITFWVGAHTDKTHRKAIMNFWGFIGAALFLFFASYIPSATIDALMVGFAIAMIQGITTPMGHGLMHSISATNRIGRDTGLMTGVSNMVAAFGPTIMGALINLAHGKYVLAFSFLIATFIISAACNIYLNRRGY
jgi:MFS family permease